MVNAHVKKQVLARDGKCKDCGSTENLTIDHIIPLSRGGLNSPDNLRTLCAQCNRRKSSQIEWKWWERIIYALHVEDIVNRIREEIKGERASLLGVLRGEIQSSSDRSRDLMLKEVAGLRQIVEFQSKKIAALEAHNKVKWTEETVIPAGYKKI